MEQQQDYNETFGFMSVLTEHDNSFQIIEQQEADERQKMQDFNPNPAPLENIQYTKETLTKSESVQYHDISSSSQVVINQKSSDEFDIQSDPILEAQLNLQTKDIHNSENSEKTHANIIMKKENMTGKKRKRIVLINDDEDSDNSDNFRNKEDEFSTFQTSSQESEEKCKENVDSLLGGNEADIESDDNEEISEIIVNPDALKARFLLKSAIIIQDPDKKKKKKPRVLDSDEEDQQTQSQIQTSIDDIGLVVDMENDTPLETEEVIADNQAGDIILFNEPTFEQSEENEEPENKNKNQKQEKYISQTPSEILTPAFDKTDENEQSNLQTEQNIVAKIKNEETIDEVLERIKPMADDDDFFEYKRSSDDDDDIKPINNEEYFGSPDKSIVQNIPKKRGPKPGTKRKILEQNPKIRQKRGDRYEKDFVDDSASSDDSSDSDSLTSSSESSTSGSSAEEINSLQPRGRPVMKKLIQPNISPKNAPMQKEIIAKKDRFYDQSRNIPDSVYFGEVKVPLHVLHTRWNSSVEEKKNNKKIQQPYYSIGVKKSINTISSKPQFIESDDPKLSTLKDLVKIAGIKINYTKLFDGVKSTDHKCMIIRRILAQKGINGEPTVAKCKKLRRDLQAKRESAELDKSVIISEGRTRRSRQNLPSSKFKESLQTSQPEIFETLSKIKSVIDSDSE